MLSLWMKSINLYAMLALVAVGGLIVTGIYTSGQRAERNKQAAEMAAINAPIIEQRAKDEAELAAEAFAAEMRDKVFASAPRQQLILDAETAKALSSR
jgi:hypothetical protein